MDNPIMGRKLGRQDKMYLKGVGNIPAVCDTVGLLLEPCTVHVHGSSGSHQTCGSLLAIITTSEPHLMIRMQILSCRSASPTHFRTFRLFLIKASPIFRRSQSKATSFRHPNPRLITRDNYDNLPVLCQTTTTCILSLAAIYTRGLDEDICRRKEIWHVLRLVSISYVLR
jgi:hypothetical protein